MANPTSPESIDDYIAGLPAAAGQAIQELRALVHATVPGVTERISYGMPTFDFQGKYLVYFGAWKNHIGMYPVTGTVAKALGEELKPYQSGKGSAQFPLGRPMPIDLIRRFIEVRRREVGGA